MLRGAQKKTYPLLRSGDSEASSWLLSVAVSPDDRSYRPHPFRSSVIAHAFDNQWCTWNLHGNPVDPSDNIQRWLRPDEDGADVLILGVQELVDLGPKTMVLNTCGDEQRQAALEMRVEQALQPPGSPSTYVKICSFGMVGLALLIYVQSWLQPYVRQLRIDRVKTGAEA
ncbi:Phosphatidylinositol 4,5-bisphosphate 5-phosphatase INP51 [Symbiodinium microadriaticum]|uniref:Phosphatidylinositol 4,5-bisphosphate 5-phosphatase INP51 n=1 Tax=Symbiodinium microadriaticum TaxID=2951 RepID=A0A1Q9DTS6_SYMMI|nr:Phosphatidylinositol 4,5-bisphosphate 5-phosphatase INP51 [Symbiodinium microadriaticum]